MAGTYSEAFCPVCGRGMSEKHTDHMLDMRNDEKHFGISKETGRAGFKNFEYTDIKDAPSFYAKLKILFLAAISVWVEKGWIKKEELINLIK